jgi:hypothetical protein
MLEGADQTLSEGSKKPGILPFGMSRQQGGRISLKRAGLCEHETVRYGELDGQSYVPLLDGLSTFRPLRSSFKKREVPRRGFPFVVPPPGFGGFLSL